MWKSAKKVRKSAETILPFSCCPLVFSDKDKVFLAQGQFVLCALKQPLQWDHQAGQSPDPLGFGGMASGKSPAEQGTYDGMLSTTCEGCPPEREQKAKGWRGWERKKLRRPSARVWCPCYQASKTNTDKEQRALERA